jgi:L-threonylcarbamoyladenylate synthase
VLGHVLEESAGVGPVRSPGMSQSHYAPRATLRLEAATLDDGDAGLDFGGIFGENKNVLDLSPGRDLAQAATNLFIFLRELDAREPACIAVAPIPHEGLGEAINDRLARAAAPRRAYL